MLHRDCLQNSLETNGYLARGSWQYCQFQQRTTLHQRRSFACFAGCKRFVYNKGLALRKKRWDDGKINFCYAEPCKELTAWRHAPDTMFLAEAPTHPLQQALKDLDRAYKNLLEGRTGFPRFKKKGRHDGFRYPDATQIKPDEKNSRTFCPK